MNRTDRTSGTGHATARRGVPRASRSTSFSLPLWSLGVIALVFVGVAIFAGVVLFQVVEDFVATGPFAVATVPSPNQSGQDPQAPSQGPAEGGNDQVVSDPVQPLPEGIRPQDRVTLLVMGIDQPCEFVHEPYRSDTMILVTVDPLSMKAAMLSIPRDLWVPIPGFGTNRINTAYRNGEISEYPGGGPALAVETVEYNFGIPVDHYVTINYDGFIEAIDLIGGIDMDVPETINDPDYPDRCYGYDPFYITAGQHHLDGEIALKYARTRATFGVDFDRAGRQQAVIMAAMERVLAQNVALLTRAPEIWNTFAENVTTDMSYQEAIGLALLAQDILAQDSSGDRIFRAVIDYNYVRDYTAPDGARVLVPIRERIRELRDAFLASEPVATPQDLAGLMLMEGAAIRVRNGTSTNLLAGDTREYLVSHGFKLVEADDADTKGQTETQIIDYSGKPATVNYLAQVLHVTPSNILSGVGMASDYDVDVILGADWQLP